MKRNLIIAMLIGIFALGFAGSSISYTPSEKTTSLVHGVLRLHSGQLQTLADAGWVCANSEVREIINSDDDTIDSSLLVEITKEYTSILTITEYDPNQVQLEDLFIKQVAASGRICEVMGHQWFDLTPKQQFINRIAALEQECGLCKKTRKLSATWSME